MKRILVPLDGRTGYARQARLWRGLGAVVVLLLIGGALLVLGPARPAAAATYRNWIAQQASQPTPGQVVRVWVNSDTAFGETSRLEYNVGANYTRIDCVFDTSYPGANWRCDIPASVQTLGTFVRYQLLTRNQSGTDYGFTGFNWNYTTTDIHWNGLLHDTFSTAYRSPFGSVPEGTAVTLKFRTEHFNVTTVTLRVYQLNADHESSTMSEYNVPYVSNDGTYDYWQQTFTMPNVTTIWYYKFKLQRGNDGISGGAGSITDWYSDDYSDDHDNLNQGGTGTPAHSEPSDSFQLTVYDPAFTTPSWMQNAVVYQIFPDRFRDGDTSNDPLPNSRFFYGNITATLHTTWDEPPEDGRVTGEYNRDFFGGDLQGLIDKLDYLKNMGVTAIYMTPIVQASSNHRYDADNYEAVDPYLGNPALFQALVAAANARGIHLILDGVYNHTSSDSLYFDRYHRYPTDGGCESLSSFYRPWYEFTTNNVPCGDGDYQGWFGYPSLAVLNKDPTTAGGRSVRDYIFGAYNNTLLPPGVTQNVTQFWYGLGAGGFRFDVADDASFHHNYWQAFRPKAESYNASGPLIGEIWPDASPWLLGDELDSVMNYRFRKTVLGFGRCASAGCFNWIDNDNNGSNLITPLVPSQFDRALKAIREDYPPAAQYAMMNLIDSHDTNRAEYVLHFSGDSDISAAKARLKVVAAFQFTYLGAPTVYYGDETGFYVPSQYNGSNGPEDDPYNRAPFPWPDTSGYPNTTYGPFDQSFYEYYQQLGHIRQNYSALRTGDFRTLLTDDTNYVYSFGRSDASAKLVVVLNNDSAGHTISVPVSGYIANGTALTDQLTGTVYTVSGGAVSLTLGAKGVAILADNPGSEVQRTATIDTPGAALAAPGLYFDGSNNQQIFVGGTSGVKKAFDGAGNQLWSQPLHGAVANRGPIIPVNGTNVVFVTSQDGYVTALRADTGASYWDLSLPTRGQIGTSVVAGVVYQPNVNVGGTPYDLVFAGTYTATSAVNRLVALDARTGDPVWAFSGPGLGLVPTSPAVDWGSNTVYFGTSQVGGSGQGVWAVDTTSGAQRWANTSIGNVVNSAPTLSADGQTLYVGTLSGTTATFYALRTSDGSVRASFTAPVAAGGDFRGAAWQDGTNLYVTAGNRLYALVDTGGTGTLPFQPGWVMPYKGAAGYATIPGGGTPLLLANAPFPGLYVGGSDGAFYHISQSDGTLAGWYFLNSGSAVSNPTYDVLHNLFYVTSNGKLYYLAGGGW